MSDDDKDWTKETRVFILPIFSYQHPDDDEPTVGCMINVKTLLPKAWREHEGAIGLFGGAVEEGETLAQAAVREFEEEMHAGADVTIAFERGFATFFKLDNHPVHILNIHGIHMTDEDIYHDAKRCDNEGMFGIILYERLQRLKPKDFVYPELLEHIRSSLEAYAKVEGITL